MVSLINASFPSPTEDPRMWYLLWEAFLTNAYSPVPTRPSVKDSDAPKFANLLSDSMLRKTLLLRKNVAFIRQQLTRGHAECAATGKSFGQRWAALDVLEREDALQAGLIKLTPDKRCIEDWWMYAPEMRKYEMCRDDGEAFVGVVRHFLVDGKGLPSIDFPILVHERVWAVYGIPLPGAEPAFPAPAAIRAFRDLILVQRHYFLSLVCLYTIAQVSGIESTIQFHEYDDYKPVSGEEKTMHDMAQQFAASMMSPAEKALFDSRLADHLSEPESTLCHVCKKGKQHGCKLLHCSKCQAINRRVLYCSRECQVWDYKSGEPPHKSICGKSLRASGPTFASPSASSVTSTNPGTPFARRSACPCENGWFSPRMRCILEITAETSSDHVLDIGMDYFPAPGEAASFDPEDVYMGANFERGCWPIFHRRDFERFLAGYSFACTALRDIIKKGVVPTLFNFEAAMKKLEISQAGTYRLHRGTLDDYRYFKSRKASLFSVLHAVVTRAYEETGDGSFQDIFGSDLEQLVECTEHDDDFRGLTTLLFTAR